jgi:hypothetical protein
MLRREMVMGMMDLHAASCEGITARWRRCTEKSREKRAFTYSPWQRYPHCRRRTGGRGGEVRVLVRVWRFLKSDWGSQRKARATEEG